jgi:hypothetical protein
VENWVIKNNQYISKGWMDFWQGKKTADAIDRRR